MAYRVLIVIFSLVLFLRSAWISDDALISLRSALNLAQGWGPGFNATESVQAYTHPLWFLLWTAIGSTTGQWFVGIVALSVAATTGTVALLITQTSSLARITLLTALLWLSNSFIDFSTSGLENPLAFLGIAILFVLTFHLSRQPDRRPMLEIPLIGLTSAGLVLIRLDLIVIIALPLLFVLWRYRDKIKAWLVAAALFGVPLIIWFTWSFLTYASVLPNTFAAKTNSLIPRTELIVTGLRYLRVTFSQDPITFLIVLAAIVLTFLLGSTLLRMWASGIALYLLYIVWIGGDFMAGRFTAVPVVISLFLLARVPIRPSAEASSASPKSMTTLAFVIALGLLGVLQISGIQSTALANPQTPRWNWMDENNIADERGEYVQRGWAAFDSTVRLWPEGDGPIDIPTDAIEICGRMGEAAIQAGPTVHVIDQCALADRFLAEKTFIPPEPFAWRPGHLSRVLPDGYVEAVQLNDPGQVRDPQERSRLRSLWEEIR